MFAKVSRWFSRLRVQRDEARAVLSQAAHLEPHGHSHEHFDGVVHTHGHDHGDHEHQHEHGDGGRNR